MKIRSKQKNSKWMSKFKSEFESSSAAVYFGTVLNTSLY